MDFLSVFTQDLYLHLFTDTKKYCPYPSCPLLSLLTAILKLWNQPGCPQQWHNSRPPEVPEDPAYYSNNKPHPELSLYSNGLLLAFEHVGVNALNSPRERCPG